MKRACGLVLFFVLVSSCAFGQTKKNPKWQKVEKSIPLASLLEHQDTKSPHTYLSFSYQQKSLSCYNTILDYYIGNISANSHVYFDGEICYGSAGAVYKEMFIRSFIYEPAPLGDGLKSFNLTDFTEELIRYAVRKRYVSYNSRRTPTLNLANLHGLTNYICGSLPCDQGNPVFMALFGSLVLKDKSFGTKIGEDLYLVERSQRRMFGEPFMKNVFFKKDYFKTSAANSQDIELESVVTLGSQ